MVALLLFRCGRHLLSRMWRWARGRFRGVKHAFSWLLFYFVKVCSGAVSLLSIPYFVKGRDRHEAGEEKNSDESSSEVDQLTDDQLTEDQLTEDESPEDESPVETRTPRAQEPEQEPRAPRAQEPAQDSPRALSTQDSPRSLSTQDSPRSLPAQDSLWSVPAQDSPRSLSTQDSLWSVPAKDSPRSLPAQDSLWSVPAQDSLWSVPAQDSPRSLPTQDSLWSVPAQDSPRSLPAQDRSWSLSTQDTPRRDRPADHHCEYDSTWDTDSDASEDQEGQSEGTHRFHSVSSRQRQMKFERFQAAARDLQNYRHNYPIKPFQRWGFHESETEDEHPNLHFYLGERPSSPDGLYIEDFHTSWRGRYDILESVHSYIQWLFPLQEPGVNPEASTLTREEIAEFCQNDKAKNHLLESYKLMLDFYGIELCDEETGEVKRAWNWKDRFTNLNRNTHNNLRITRILKCLGTLGFPHYQAPLVRFFLEETQVHGELHRVKDSVLNYFLFTVLDKKQRRILLEFAYDNFDKKEEFVWCPVKIQRKWEKPRIETAL